MNYVKRLTFLFGSSKPTSRLEAKNRLSIMLVQQNMTLLDAGQTELMLREVAAVIQKHIKLPVNNTRLPYVTCKCSMH